MAAGLRPALACGRHDRPRRNKRTMTLPEADLSDRVRPVTWLTWLFWVAVAAAEPVLSTISATALNKQFAPGAETNLIFFGLMVTIAFCALAPPILQGLVLRRLMPRLSITFWFAACCWAERCGS